MTRMGELLFLLLYTFVIDFTVQYKYDNVTVDRVPMQLEEFRREHPKPIGILTTTAGEPVDIRSTYTLNTDIFSNQYHLDSTSHSDVERIPERTTHAKGNGAYGYFEVTHDVSKYTSADVFNGIGKRTPFFGRFSTAIQNRGGPELGRENKGLAIKLYTKEGNLDLLCLNIPVFFYRDPIDFAHLIRAFRRNPKTNIFDLTMAWDFMTLKPDLLHNFLWLQSDFGLPYGYRRMDIFPIHTYEITNKHGDSYYARFNFRTEQGLANLTTAEGIAIASRDPDFFTRDIYNSIANKNYPSWRLEMDILSFDEAAKLDYNPFDVTRLWKRGTYRTVTVGRLVVDKRTDNEFRDTEQSTFNPANLVPGIPGPVDIIFKARRFSYRDANRHRVHPNHDNVEVNRPKYRKTYTRDSNPPVNDNMGDSPNYYPNSFNGPQPIVDLTRPKVRLTIYDRNVVDLEPISEFYNDIVGNNAHRQRLAENTASTLVNVEKHIVQRALKILHLIDEDLGRRVTASYIQAVKVEEEAAKLDARERYAPLAKCTSLFIQGRLK